MDKEIDRTLNRAQKYFINALLTLMEEKPYGEISVSELSERAQYDRRTFYRYFKSKDDILCLYYAKLLQEMAELTNQKGMLTPRSFCLAYFEFWNGHKDFLMLLDRHRLLHFLGESQELMIYHHVGHRVQKNLPDTLSETAEFSQYSFYFTQGGLWSVLIYWVRTGMKQSPAVLTEHILNTFIEMEKLI